MDGNNQLLDGLTRGIMRDLQQYQADNTDYWRENTSRSAQLKRRTMEKLLSFASKKGFVRRHPTPEVVAERLALVLRDIDGLQKFYDSLEDDASRRLLIDVLKFRILGNRHSRLPLNNEQFWRTRRNIDHDFLKQRKTVKTGPWYLNRYQLDEAHGSIDLDQHPLGLLNTFLLEQYAYKKGGVVVQAEEGETVIDAGGCLGDTALYFANKVGSSGLVYCYEFVPDNLKILRRNLEHNPGLAPRIEIVENAVWDKSGEEVLFRFNGPGTTVAEEQDENTTAIKTLSIDDLVKERGARRVDFIKMDIEGAEFNALQGAEQTIREFRPKLAISVYHRQDDFIKIPEYIRQLGSYQFFLDHFTIYQEETVLFARPA